MGKAQYVKAQFSLGKLYFEQNNFKDAEVYWDNIELNKDDSSKKSLGLMIEYLWSLQNVEKFRLTSKYLKCSSDEIKIFKHHVIEKIVSFSDQDIAHIFENIFNTLNTIIEKLHLSNVELKEYCNRFAHYTQHSTALTILDDNQNSSFRLSTMHFMNDPTEGRLVDQLLDLHDYYKENPYIAFASCFSFNHDSLNQFRLYGKTNNKENSGVSLVFKSTFFLDDLSQAKHIHNTKLSSISALKKEDENIMVKKEDVNRVSLQPLYRCIYIDPDHTYLKVAQRSRLSFYRSKISGEYEQYVSKIKDVELTLFELLENLKNDITLLKDCLREKSNNELHKRAIQLLNEIILPLRYLIKHAAFEEEDECRMIYITHLKDPAIKHNHKEKWFYVEYAEPIRKHIDRVYLGKGAEDYRPFFERALGDKSKVKSSNNPFRT